MRERRSRLMPRACSDGERCVAAGGNFSIPLELSHQVWEGDIFDVIPHAMTRLCILCTLGQFLWFYSYRESCYLHRNTRNGFGDRESYGDA